MRFRKKTKKYYFAVKRSSKTTVIVVCATVAVCLATLLVIHAFTRHAQAESERWRAEAQKNEQDQDKWTERNQNAGTVEDMKDYAEENLGLTDQDTVIVTPKN